MLKRPVRGHYLLGILCVHAPPWPWEGNNPHKKSEASEVFEGMNPTIPLPNPILRLSLTLRDADPSSLF